MMTKSSDTMAKGYRIQAATGIHHGDRNYQQDQVHIFEHARFKGCILGIVADGMGGRSGGRNASEQVMLTSQQLFDRYDPTIDDTEVVLKQLLEEAHTIIKLVAISSEEEPHSTLAAFLLNPDTSCHWIHSGDSRIYHFRKGKLVQRTSDHSYVQSLLDCGEITEDQALVHPKANVLLGCLGGHKEPPMSHHRIKQLGPGDSLLACSDGLWHYVNHAEMGSVLSALTARQASEELIQKARARAQGKGDNLSLAILKFETLD